MVWAATFNFLAAFGFGTAVARTVGSGMVNLDVVTSAVIFRRLDGGDIWDLITWYVGLPTSSSRTRWSAATPARHCQGRLRRADRLGLDQYAHLHRAGAAGC